MALFEFHIRNPNDEKSLESISRSLGETSESLGHVLRKLDILIKRMSEMSALIDQLIESARVNTEADKAMVTVITSLRTEIQNAINSGDMAKVQSVIDSLDQQTVENLAAATVEGTESDPNA